MKVIGWWWVIGIQDILLSSVVPLQLELVIITGDTQCKLFGCCHLKRSVMKQSSFKYKCYDSRLCFPAHFLHSIKRRLAWICLTIQMTWLLLVYKHIFLLLLQIHFSSSLQTMLWYAQIKHSWETPECSRCFAENKTFIGLNDMFLITSIILNAYVYRWYKTQLTS